jgi:hypothetical protein
MMRQKLLLLVAVWVMSLFVGTSAWGQTITSTIVGQVNDPSGGAVPEAQVTARNAETGIATLGASESSGTYTIPQLQPGIYNITVAKSGFATYEVTGIRVSSSQTVRVDVELKVGAVQQVVSVNGEAPLVHTDTQTISSSMPTRMIEDLPKSSQSIDTLIGLVPGASYLGSDANIAGSGYWGGNDWNLNGVSIQDASNGRGAGTYGLGLITLPSTNALQEFKVSSGALNAEFRNTAGVSMVLKQGTNRFHGEAYGYFENKNLNANSFLNNARGQARPDYDRDQYGGLIGGPIKKDKLFFFVDIFHFRQVTPTIVSLEFPSAAMRQGDFSALCTTFTSGLCTSGTQLYNPQTGAPYAANYINPTTFDSRATALMAYLPVPNLTTNAVALPSGVSNYQAAVANRYPKTNLDTRMDWQISKTDSLNGFFRWSNSPSWFQASGSTPPNWGNYANFRDEDWAVSATETHSFGATGINELRLTWHDYIQARQGQNFSLKPWTLVPSVPVQNTGGLPTTTMTGYTGLSDWGAGIPFPTYDVEISDNFTKIKGRHTFKAGILETGYKFSVPGADGHLTIQLGAYNGSFGSVGSWTGGKGWAGITGSQGNAFADFMLGDLSATNYATLVNSTVLSSRDWEAYAQDTWQATPRLTINYGLRYMYQSPWQERNRYYSSLDLSNSKLVLLENSSTPTAPPTSYPSLLSTYPFETSQSIGWSTNYYTPNKMNWGPRLGFAWRPFGGSKTAVRGGYGVFYNFIGAELGTLEMTFNPPFRIGPTFSTNLPATAPAGGYAPDLTLANPFPTAGAKAPSANPLIYYTPRNYRNPMQQQWTITVEQQLGQQWMARASYVGAQTQHLFWYAFNINQPAVQQPNVVLQNQRPFQPWGNINYNASGGIQNFGQLQLELIKRFSKGLSTQFEYNWTRSLDDVPAAGSLNNPWCYMCDYGNTDYLTRQRLAFNYVYELPVGEGRHWLNRKGVANAALGGWEIAGITTYASGTPFSVAFNVPSNIVGWWGGRPDRASGAGLYDGKNGSSHDIVSGVSWFNAAAFAPPQKWAYGNSSRNSVYGPGSENWDMSLMKMFYIKGEQGLRLQVRTDWFDAFNHFNLSNPSTTMGDTRDGGLAVSTFGRIYGGSGSRVIQLAVRLIF